MNQILLGHRLGAISSPTLQRFENERRLYSLDHDPSITFAANNFLAADVKASEHTYAHQAGCTALSSSTCGRYLASAGADASIRFWDLVDPPHAGAFTPITTLTRAHEQAHKNSITSLSIYAFDPTPTTLLSTSFDKTFLLTQITPTSLAPLHSFPLDYAPYCHNISPIPSPQPLIAVGTAHPATRLLDLRSGHSTHSLPGHNGSVYSLAWSPRIEHVLVSGATDGRVLFFDIRRANAAFASLDSDDAVGVGPGSEKMQSQLLNFNTTAHNGPVTSVQFTPYPHNDSLVTTGHDQRIRVWSVSSGRNELVHFGPRIHNDRQGQLAPLTSPPGNTTKPSREVLFWPNDDAKGEIHMHSLREGQLIKVMKMEGVKKIEDSKGSARMLGKGRINQIVWRNGDGSQGPEIVSAHGDGSIAMWRSWEDEDGDQVPDSEEESGRTHLVEGGPSTVAKEIEDAENKRKRKREMLEGLVEGLTKKVVK